MVNKFCLFGKKRTASGTRGVLVLLLAFLAASCADSGLDVTDTGPPDPQGNIVASTGCKSFEKDDSLGIMPITADCLMHRWDGMGTLSLMHVNAGFNCCPGELTADITIENGLITIQEYESESACRCLCLYDVEYEITDLPTGQYTIRFIEIYTTEEDEILEITVDLRTTPSGIHCVNRDHYPWDVSVVRNGPFGFLVDATGCKQFSTNGAIDNTPPTQDCIDYHYNGGDVLLLTHINAGLNCCPVIDPQITIATNIIRIEEKEVEGLCDCLCLFDLNYEIRNLPPGEYTIEVIEPYVRVGDEKLEFTVDLSSTPSGTHCVERTYYPWGSATRATDRP